LFWRRKVSMAGESDHDRAGKTDEGLDPIRNDYRPHPARIATPNANPPPRGAALPTGHVVSATAGNGRRT
jgi:hypothetical protein